MPLATAPGLPDLNTHPLLTAQEWSREERAPNGPLVLATEIWPLAPLSLSTPENHLCAPQSQKNHCEPPDPTS